MSALAPLQDSLDPRQPFLHPYMALLNLMWHFLALSITLQVPCSLHVDSQCWQLSCIDLGRWHCVCVWHRATSGKVASVGGIVIQAFTNGIMNRALGLDCILFHAILAYIEYQGLVGLRSCFLRLACSLVFGSAYFRPDPDSLMIFAPRIPVSPCVSFASFCVSLSLSVSLYVCLSIHVSIYLFN